MAQAGDEDIPEHGRPPQFGGTFGAKAVQDYMLWNEPEGSPTIGPLVNPLAAVPIFPPPRA